MTNNELRTIRDKIEQGFSIRAIAKLISKSKTAVHYQAKKHNFTKGKI